MSERSLLYRLVVQIEKEQQLKTQVCDHLNEIGRTMDAKQWDISIARTVCSGGLAGSLLTIGGLLLAPVTYGISLGLTVAGQVIDVKRGKQCFTKAIADDVLNSKALTDAQSKLDKYQEIVRVLLDICDELEVLDKHQLKRLCKQNLGRSATTGQLQIRLDVVKGLKLVLSTGGSAVEGSTPRSTGVDVSETTTIWDVVDAAMEVLTIGGVVICVLSVPLDLKSILIDVMNIHNRLPSETAQETRALAGYLLNNGDTQKKERALAHITDITRKYDRPHWDSTTWKLVCLRLQVLGTVLIMCGIMMAIVELDYGFDKLIRYGVATLIASGVSCLSCELYIQLKSSLYWREADREVNAFILTNFIEGGGNDGDVSSAREVSNKFKNCCLHIAPMTFINFTELICIGAKLILDAWVLGYTLKTNENLDTLAEHSAVKEIIPLVGLVSSKTHHTGLSVDVSGAIWYLVTMPLCLVTLLTCWTETIGRKKTPFKEAVDRLIKAIRNDLVSDQWQKPESNSVRIHH